MTVLRRYWVGALLVGAALVVTVAASANGASTAPLKLETGVLASVTDGDTIRLRDGRRVRLVQIDAPEVGSGECYSRASATALRRLLPAGSTVRLVADPRLDKVDRYGRLLRYVWRGSVHTNVALVRAGAAAPWFYGGVKGKYAAQLVAAANAAKAGRSGSGTRAPGRLSMSRRRSRHARASRLHRFCHLFLRPLPIPHRRLLPFLFRSSVRPRPRLPSPTPPPTPAAQCADTIDNDGDGKIDYPTDPGCSSAADTDETDPAPPPSNCSASYPDFCIPPPPARQGLRRFQSEELHRPLGCPRPRSSSPRRRQGRPCL